jgi:hypothetical protein
MGLVEQLEDDFVGCHSASRVAGARLASKRPSEWHFAADSKAGSGDPTGHRWP